MHFVDRNWVLQMIAMRARFHPLLISPLVGSEITHHGGGLGRNLGGKSVWIGFLLAKTVRMGPHGVLVVNSGANARQEDFPNSAGAQPHGMAALVPVVEISHHGDHLGVGRPHGETHARNPVALHQVRAHGAIALILGSFAVDVQIEVGDKPGKTIRIVDLGLPPVP